jgi:hypothetical protein
MGELNLDKIEREYRLPDSYSNNDKVSSLSAWRMLRRNDEIPYALDSGSRPDTGEQLLEAC